EKAEVWPSVERLHALCYVLHAHEEEIVALTCGHLAMQPTEAQVSLEDSGKRLREVWDMTSHAPLWELNILVLEAALWPLAAQSARGQHLLAEAYAFHADHLAVGKRWSEMETYADRALDLMPEKSLRGFFWVCAGVASAHGAVHGGVHPAPKRGLA